MKLLIDIPTEYEAHFRADRLNESLHRLLADAHCLAGLYERETAVMLIEVFRHAVPVPPHGRLVDMDELRKKLLSAPEARFTPKELAWVLDCEETAPTIIPAEEGERRLQKSKEWKT